MFVFEAFIGAVLLAALSLTARLLKKERRKRARLEDDAGAREDALRRELEGERERRNRLVERLARLYEHSTGPGGEVRLPEFAEALLQTAASLLQIGLGIVFTAEPGAGEGIVLAAQGLRPEELARLRIHPGEGALGKAWQARRAVQALESGAAAPAEDPWLAPPYLLFPLWTDERPIGLLLLAQPASGGFTSDDARLAQLLAACAAGALGRQALEEDLRRTCDQSAEALARSVEAKDST